MYKNIRGLLFDKDGTLFDFHLSWTGWAVQLIDALSEGDGYRRAALAEALEFDLENGAFLPGALSIAGTVREQAQVISPVMQHWDLAEIEAYLVAAARRAHMVPATPLAPLMAGLRGAGFRLGIATNDAETSARRHLEIAELSGFFDYVAGYDSGHGAKPDPGMCTGFAVATGLAPEACVMIGDSRHDLMAGRAAGMATVAVLTGPATADELSELADAVLPDISALPRWLGLAQAG